MTIMRMDVDTAELLDSLRRAPKRQLLAAYKIELLLKRQSAALDYIDCRMREDSPAIRSETFDALRALVPILTGRMKTGVTADSLASG